MQTAIIDNTFLDYVLSIEDKEEQRVLFQFWAIVYNQPIVYHCLGDEIFTIRLLEGHDNILPMIDDVFLVFPLSEFGKYFHIVKTGDVAVDNYSEIIKREIINNRCRFIAHIASEE